MKTAGIILFICVIAAAFMAVLVFSGCANTVIYGPDGKRRLHTNADITGLRYRSPDGTVLEAASVDHSTPTKAYGEAAGARIREVGAAAAAAGIFGL